jgi:hypothetical protein
VGAKSIARMRQNVVNWEISPPTEEAASCIFFWRSFFKFLFALIISQ